jgi:hypothetical protein
MPWLRFYRSAAAFDFFVSTPFFLPVIVANDPAFSLRCPHPICAVTVF